ncbi:MAG: hypothetical protein ACKO6A_05010 [Bacteroidota bacterium]
MIQHTFFRRLFYYLIGVGIGLIFVFFIFKNKGCSWLPQNKVKETITHKIILNGSKKISATNIKKILEKSTVNFDKSNKKTPFKTYFFESTGTKDGFCVSFFSDSYFAVIHDNINDLQAFKTDTFLKIINLPEMNASLFNFEVSQQLLTSLKKIDFTRENYSNTLLQNAYISCNLNKNNNSEASFLITDNTDSTFLIFTWKEVMLTPKSINRNIKTIH